MIFSVKKVGSTVGVNAYGIIFAQFHENFTKKIPVNSRYLYKIIQSKYELYLCL